MSGFNPNCDISSKTTVVVIASQRRSNLLAQLPHLLSKNTSELGSKECKVVDNIMFYFNISKIVTNRLVKL
jgi:hypothetical protein